jgi:histidinol-phosphatase (PHP family)
MQLPADYHMHTPLCRHARGEPTEYAAHAERIGLKEIGFSDHSPMREDDFDNWRMRISDLDDYVERVRKARKDHPNLIIRLALEVDYLPGHEEWIRELSSRHPWDYLVGSVHYISDSFAVDDPSQQSEWKRRDALDIWTEYFERLTAAAGSKLFDIIGHADLPKKFGIVPREDCTLLFARFLKAAQASGAAIELNTAGLRKDCREIYPSRQILELALQSRVPITFGSDAHAPDEVGMDFQAAVELARSVGYTKCCRFERRQKTEVEF